MLLLILSKTHVHGLLTAPSPLILSVYNASGPRTGSSDALAKVGSSKSCAILTKSATLLPQNGNPLPRTYTSPNFSINSEGLPNKSIDYYIDSETIKESVLDSGKPYFVSISGKSLDDNVEMMKVRERAKSNSSK